LHHKLAQLSRERLTAASDRGGALADGTGGSKSDPMTSIEHKTGTSNAAYDLVSVLYHALQGAETYDRYIADAQQRGDDELARFMRDVQDKDRAIAEQAKRLLKQRLDS
jgi:hypothetical protein